MKNKQRGLVSVTKQWLKSLMQTLAPQTTSALMAARSRNHSHKLFKEWGLREINNRLINEIGSSVIAGPFRGLRLTPMTYDEHIGPYLLGTYEYELHACWESLTAQPINQIIDVGSKFGYYAIGLALRLPTAQVIAFDIDWWARKAMAEMVMANDVKNVTIRASCTPMWLCKDLRPGALVVSDCEGYEAELFSAPLTEAMKTSTFVIETHEMAAPGVTAHLKSHFAGTHRLTQISSSNQPSPPSQGMRSLSPEELTRACREIRSPQDWLVFLPLRKVASISS